MGVEEEGRIRQWIRHRRARRVASDRIRTGRRAALELKRKAFSKFSGGFIIWASIRLGASIATFDSSSFEENMWRCTSVILMRILAL